MKILFNCLNMNKGGAERVICVLSNYFIKDNDVTILTLKNQNYNYELNEKIKKVNITKPHKNKFLRKLSKISLIEILKLNKAIRKCDPDVIISFLPEPSFKLMLLNKFSNYIKNKPIIISIRNNPKLEYKNKIIKYIMKFLYKDLDGLVLQTDSAKQFFVEELKSVTNSTIIFNPVDDSFVSVEPFLGNRKKEFVSVGRLEKIKNHFLLIDSFIEFHKDNKDFILKIYGDGSLRDEIENYIIKNKAEKYIKLMGKTDDIKKICDATCFILSSNSEGMPNALIEAMCLGVPCISTKVPGAVDLIEDGVNGFLVDINNKNQMVEKMREISNNYSLQEKFSKNSIKISKKVNTKKISNEWITYIKNIIKEFD